MGHTVSSTLMETANHSLEMEKRQIAISSSSERDKGTFTKDTPCSESETRTETTCSETFVKRDCNRYMF